MRSGRLSSLLIRDHLLQLRAHRAVQTALGGEPSLNPVACGGACGDQLVRACPLPSQQRSAPHDLLLEPNHLVDQCRVLLRDRVDGLDPGDEVVEAVGAEEHRERGLLVLRRVDRDDPLRERKLRLREIAARYAECLAVDVELVLDAPQLLGRRLVTAVRPLRRRVELLELHEDGARLGPFRADPIRVCSRRRRPDKAHQEQPEKQRRDGCLPSRHAQ